MSQCACGNPITDEMYTEIAIQVLQARAAGEDLRVCFLCKRCGLETEIVIATDEVGVISWSENPSPN